MTYKVWYYRRSFFIARLWRILLTRMQIGTACGFIKAIKFWQKIYLRSRERSLKCIMPKKIKWKAHESLIIIDIANDIEVISNYYLIYDN